MKNEYVMRTNQKFVSQRSKENYNKKTNEKILKTFQNYVLRFLMWLPSKLGLALCIVKMPFGD